MFVAGESTPHKLGSLVEAEAKAMILGLELAKNDAPLKIRMQVFLIRRLTAEMVSCEFSFVKRAANQVAYILAHYGTTPLYYYSLPEWKQF